jgi:hypothetical protein
MTTPRARPPAPLPRRARAMLAAYRDANAIPATVEDRIWSVVGAEDAPEPAFDPLEAAAPRRTNVRVIGWAGAVLAVAAVLVLAWQLGGLLGERRRSASAPGAAVMQGGGDASQGRATAGAGAAVPRSTEPSATAPTAPDLQHSTSDASAVLERQSPAVDRSAAPETADPPLAPAHRGPADEPEPDTAGSTPTEPEPPASSTLAAERELVAEAWRALALGDTTQALDVTAEHARRFPEGLLAPERAAIETIAVCHQGATDGHRRATAFHRAHPRSPLADRVDEACGAPPREKPPSP